MKKIIAIFFLVLSITLGGHNPIYAGGSDAERDPGISGGEKWALLNVATISILFNSNTIYVDAHIVTNPGTISLFTELNLYRFTTGNQKVLVDTWTGGVYLQNTYDMYKTHTGFISGSQYQVELYVTINQSLKYEKVRVYQNSYAP